MALTPPSGVEGSVEEDRQESSQGETQKQQDEKECEGDGGEDERARDSEKDNNFSGSSGGKTEKEEETVGKGETMEQVNASPIEIAQEEAQSDVVRTENASTIGTREAQARETVSKQDVSRPGLVENGAVQVEVPDVEGEEKSVDNDDELGLCILHRSGTGSTAYRERQTLKSVNAFVETVEDYYASPTIYDYPIQALNPALQKKNPMIFLEFSSEDTVIGKLVFEIFEDIVPRTAKNFISLCCGDPAKDELTYRRCRVHSIIENFMVVSGDVTNGDGSGGRSVYGDTFPDESFELCHVGPGILTMINNGPDSNNSQFAILLARAEWLDGRNVVVGKLMQGYEILRKMVARYATTSGVPSSELFISSCGLNI
mmetsp:Transcript_46871/g.146923  ORF Transcript_46871/g.146923 Transcript_46871/m.146923 type:complete len:372 (-) Transcript_46871:108-1223(-)